MDKIISFEETLKQSPGKRHLLLGNGFSMGFDYEAFNYKSLKEKISDPDVKKIFERFPDIVDFEHLLKICSDAEKIIHGVCEDGDAVAKVINQLKTKGNTIKDNLIVALTENPPKSDVTHQATQAKYKAASDFRDKFCKVFTLNYDLLLYYAGLSGNGTFLDGFSGNQEHGYTWSLDFLGNKENANVFFLHGALHLQKYESDSNGGKIYKHSPQVALEYELVPTPIVQQVREGINNGRYPLTVVAGESKYKQDFIIREPYLSWCYDHFKTLEGYLFIYGCSFDNKDDHLYLNISDKVSHLFIGVYDKNNGFTKIEEKVRKIKEKRPTLEVTYFCSKSANVWEMNSQ